MNAPGISGRGQRWRDMMATRGGFALALATLWILSLTWSALIHRSDMTLWTNQTYLEERQIGNGYTALSDLYRLTLASAAFQSGAVTPEAQSDFVAALDILYVRAQHFERVISEIGKLTEYFGFGHRQRFGTTAAEEVAAALRQTIAIGDRAVETGGLDEKLSRDLRDATDLARSRLDRYLTEMRQLQEELLQHQTDMLVGQSKTMRIFLALMTLIGTALLVVLRREIIHRQRRDLAERRADYLAFYDPLTGLPNRVQFQDRATGMLASGRPCTIAVVDLDNFKDANDRLGHAMGDAVLKEVAQRIRIETESNQGIAGRLGGDEFAVCLPTVNPGFLQRFCKALIDECARPIIRGRDTVLPGISIGLATNQQHGRIATPSYEHMMRVADFALYSSKSEGRGRYTFYDADLEKRFNNRRRLIDDLPGAIRRRELQVYFQPKVDISAWRVCGFEALVRWHRDGKLLPPAEFIHVAEESGQILELDRYMLDTAVGIMADWNRAHETAFGISVNLSGTHFLKAQPREAVARVLDAHHFPPELLTLEITETVQLGNWETVGRAIADLRDLGCRISIDDFGTGYSSLAYLRAIAADELKIDKSLVDEIETSGEARFILDAVFDLARSLALDVVVEGIERPSQLDHIRSLGAQVAQGYLFSRPAPAEEALQATRRRSGELIAVERRAG